jgi:hypothetical protein
VRLILQAAFFIILASGSFAVVSRLRSAPAASSASVPEGSEAAEAVADEHPSGGREPATDAELRAIMEALSKAAANRASAPEGRTAVELPDRLSALQQLSTGAGSTGLTASRVHGALQMAFWRAAHRCWSDQAEVGATTIRFRATIARAGDALAVSGADIDTTEGDELPPAVQGCIRQRVVTVKQIMHHDGDLEAIAEDFVSDERLSLVIRGRRG